MSWKTVSKKGRNPITTLELDAMLVTKTGPCGATAGSCDLAWSSGRDCFNLNARCDHDDRSAAMVRARFGGAAVVDIASWRAPAYKSPNSGVGLGKWQSHRTQDERLRDAALDMMDDSAPRLSSRWARCSPVQFLALHEAFKHCKHVTLPEWHGQIEWPVICWKCEIAVGPTPKATEILREIVRENA